MIVCLCQQSECVRSGDFYSGEGHGEVILFVCDQCFSDGILERSFRVVDDKDDAQEALPIAGPDECQVVGNGCKWELLRQRDESDAVMILMLQKESVTLREPMQENDRQPELVEYVLSTRASVSTSQ